MPTFTINRSVFEQLPVRRVEVRVHPRASAPAGKDAHETERHVFEPGAPSAQTDLAWTPERTTDPGSYALRVVFDDDRSPSDSPEIPVPKDTDRSAPVQAIELGIRVFDARALPDTIRAVELSFVDLSGQPKCVRLSADVPLFVVFAGIDYQAGEPIDYTLDYLLTDGNYRPSRLSSDTVLITVENPLHPKTVTFEAIGLAPSEAATDAAAVHLVQLTTSHLEEGVDWRIAGTSGDAMLTSAQPRKSITFDAVDPTRALTRYLGVTIFTDGTQQTIPDTLIPETTIPVGDTPLWWTVEVDPGLVDWRSYSVVVVEIRALNAIAPGNAPAEPTGDADEIDTPLFFWQGVPSRYWSFQVPLRRSGTFAWRALYVRSDGTAVWTAERTETSHTAVLPSRLPSGETRTPAPARLDGVPHREVR